LLRCFVILPGKQNLPGRDNKARVKKLISLHPAAVGREDYL